MNNRVDKNIPERFQHNSPANGLNQPENKNNPEHANNTFDRPQQLDGQQPHQQEINWPEKSEVTQLRNMQHKEQPAMEQRKIEREPGGNNNTSHFQQSPLQNNQPQQLHGNPQVRRPGGTNLYQYIV